VNAPESISHESAIELLPWLVNGSMGAEEEQRVREHALSCIICRRELAELRLFANLVSEEAKSVHIPAPDMRNINARIDGLIGRRNRWREGLYGFRAVMSKPWRLAFAVQTCLVIVLATVLLWPGPPDSEFTTLTQPRNIPDGRYVRVVFNPDMAISELANLLDEMKLTVADGPTAHGVYTLGVSATMSEAKLARLLERLQGEPDVQFAQWAIQ